MSDTLKKWLAGFRNLASRMSKVSLSLSAKLLLAGIGISVLVVLGLIVFFVVRWFLKMNRALEEALGGYVEYDWVVLIGIPLLSVIYVVRKRMARKKDDGGKGGSSKKEPSWLLQTVRNAVGLAISLFLIFVAFTAAVEFVKISLAPEEKMTTLEAGHSDWSEVVHVRSGMSWVSDQPVIVWTEMTGELPCVGKEDSLHLNGARLMRFKSCSEEVTAKITVAYK